MDECCVACLTDNRNSFASSNEKEKVEDFLQEKLPPVFVDFPVILCNGCMFQLEKFRNFRQNVINSISTLTAQLNKIYGCRVFVEPLEMIVDSSTSAPGPGIKVEKLEIELEEQGEVRERSDNEDFNGSDNDEDFRGSDNEGSDSDSDFDVPLSKSKPKNPPPEPKVSTNGDKNQEKFRIVKSKVRKQRETMDPHCSVCKKTIKSQPFVFHVKSTHFKTLGENSYQCKVCDKILKCAYHSTITAHFENHRIFPKPRGCDTCTETFTNMGEWRRHFQKHRKAGFQCLLCAKKPIFKLKSEINEHLRTEHDDTDCEQEPEMQPETAPIVKEERNYDDDASLDDPWDANFHPLTNKSTEKLDYRVDESGGRTRVYTISKGKTTKWHQYIRKYKDKLPSRKLEAKKRSFHGIDVDCSLCGLKNLARNYRSHVLSTHAIIEDGKHFCKECNTECSSLAALVYHFDAHRVFDPPKKCGEKDCNEYMDSMMVYKRHTEAHRHKKEFKCPECDLSYYRIGSLQFHYMVIHTGALMCRFCQTVFELKEDYDRHLKAEQLARKEKKRLVRYTRIRLEREKEKEEKLKKGIVDDEKDEESEDMENLPMVFSRPMTKVNVKKRTTPIIPPKFTKVAVKSYCHICRISVKNFKEHVTDLHATKLDVGGYKCNICNSCLKDNFSVHFYQQHREYEEEQQCTECDFKTFHYESFRKHTWSHKRGLFECHYCGLGYTEKTSLRYHMFFKHSPLFICNYCCKTFEDEEVFKAHKADEKQKRRGDPNICDICGFTTYHASYMKGHMTRVHSNLKVDSVTCDQCGKRCKSALNLKDHLRNFHGEKNVVCNECGKRFRNQAYMREHIKIYHSTEILQCQLCEKTGTPIQMKRHMYMSHDTTRPWVCKMCNMAFKVKAGLQKHLHTHAGTRPFVCHLCSKGFYNRDVVKKHLEEAHRIWFTNEELKEYYKRIPSKFEEEHLGRADDDN